VLYAIRTMIVKAAPRFATILCLLNVRLERGACVLVEDVPLVGQLRCLLARVNTAVEGCIHTLAMPIGDADSAIVSCVLRMWLWVVVLGWPVSGGLWGVNARNYQKTSTERGRGSSFCVRVRTACRGSVLGGGGECCVVVLLYNLASPFSARPPWASASPDWGKRHQRWSVVTLASARALIFKKKLTTRIPAPATCDSHDNDRL